MEYGAISLCLLGLAVAGTIKGATGIGFTTAALPFLTLAAGHRSAMVLVLASAVASNFALMLKAGDLTSVGRRFAPLYIAIMPVPLVQAQS